MGPTALGPCPCPVRFLKPRSDSNFGDRFSALGSSSSRVPTCPQPCAHARSPHSPSGWQSTDKQPNTPRVRCLHSWGGSTGGEAPSGGQLLPQHPWVLAEDTLVCLSLPLRTPQGLGLRHPRGWVLATQSSTGRARAAPWCCRTKPRCPCHPTPQGRRDVGPTHPAVPLFLRGCPLSLHCSGGPNPTKNHLQENLW